MSAAEGLHSGRSSIWGPKRVTRSNAWLASTVTVAALVRFATLGVQPHWLDEAYTVALVRLPFGEMLHTIPRTESTPPLYYVAAWLWTHVFGSSDIALRSLSALFGTATVAIVYVIGRDYVSQRVGQVAVGLAAVNPFLVWFSQEARAYALMVFLVGLSMVFLCRALERPGPWHLLGWVISSSLAVATHYFAVFIVVAEAAWLVYRRFERATLVATCAIAVAMGALAPLALHQRKHEYGFEHLGLVTRVAQLPKQFLVGFGSPAKNALALSALMLALYAVISIIRAGSPLWRRIAPLLAIALAAVALPVVLSLAGTDIFDAKNSIAVILPTIVLLASGYSVSRRGIGAAVALAVVSVVVIALVVHDPDLQRVDWRVGCRVSRGADAPACAGREAGLLHTP